MSQTSKSASSRVLVITGDVLGAKMAGPAIRAWEMAKALREVCEVRLVSTQASTLEHDDFHVSYADEAELRRQVEWCDALVFQGYTLSTFPWIRGTGKIIVADIYDPMHLEYLEQGKDDSPRKRTKMTEYISEVLNVQLELAVRGVTPEEKREALNRYRELDPNNSYADYLAALLDFQQGRTEDAIANLDAADKHAEYRTPAAEMRQPCEDLYLSAGLTPVEAKAAAMFLVPTVFVAPMSQVANYLANVNPLGMQQRDEATSGRLMQSALGFVRKISGDRGLIVADMMRISVETRVIRAFPQDEPLPGSGKTPAQRLEELTAERTEIATLGKDVAAIQADMTESEFLKYLKRVEAEGEVNALRNLRDK